MVGYRDDSDGRGLHWTGTLQEEADYLVTMDAGATLRVARLLVLAATPEVTVNVVTLKTSRTAEITIECDRRIESRWPLTDRLAALSGCPTTPGIADDVLAHALERNRCLALIASATDILTVMEVTPSWPV